MSERRGPARHDVFSGGDPLRVDHNLERSRRVRVVRAVAAVVRRPDGRAVDEHNQAQRGARLHCEGERRGGWVQAGGGCAGSSSSGRRRGLGGVRGRARVHVAAPAGHWRRPRRGGGGGGGGAGASGGHSAAECGDCGGDEPRRLRQGAARRPLRLPRRRRSRLVLLAGGGRRLLPRRRLPVCRREAKRPL